MPESEAVRLLPVLLAGLAVPSCSLAPADLAPWPEAARGVRAGLEAGFLELAGALARHDDAAAPMAGRAEPLRAETTRCLAGWTALERYAERARASLLTNAFMSAGIEEQVQAVAALHRELLATGAEDPLGDARAAETARAMRSAPITAEAFAAAAEALGLLAEDVAWTHEVLAEQAAAAAAAADEAFGPAVAGPARRLDVLRAEARALEDELRMEAAGAGRARAGAETLLAELTERIREVEAEQSAWAGRRVAVAAAFDGYEDRARRSAAAARAWAAAHSEVARAILAGESEPRLSPLRAATAGLAPR